MKKDFSPELLEIRQRILALADKFGIIDLKKGGALARKLGVHNSVIKRLIEKTSFPGIENIRKICINAHISANYLLFGNLQSKTNEPGESYFSQTPAPIDTEKISQTVKIMEEYFRKVGLMISSERKGKLTALLYEYWVTEKLPPDDEIIKNHLRLIP